MKFVSRKEKKSTFSHYEPARTEKVGGVGSPGGGANKSLKRAPLHFFLRRGEWKFFQINFLKIISQRVLLSRYGELGILHNY